MITALAMMLAVAGYFSFMNKDISDPNMVAEASADLLREEYEISDEDIADMETTEEDAEEFFNDEFADEFDEAFEDVADDAESDDIF